jgi:ABC-type branched-subunit amino acid transport system substrate-binding protein
VTSESRRLNLQHAPLARRVVVLADDVDSFGGTCAWQGGAVPAAPPHWTVPNRQRAVRLMIAGVAIACLTSACDSALDRPLPTATAVTTTPATPTAESITPVTPDGLITGPGVSDAAITLGLLVDSTRDRGFSDGVELWQQAVNTSGGLCGRTVQLVTTGVAPVPNDVLQAYDAVGRDAIGLITLPPPAESAALNTGIAADQIPTLTPAGTSAQLGPGRPIVVGPTQDILAINGLDYLLQSGRLEQGGHVGVLTDGSAWADNALRGARWWAKERGVVLDERESDPDAAPADWGAATAVLALTDSRDTERLVLAAPAKVTILTMIDGYDPANWSADALAAAAAGRVLVSTAAPAYGSDYPAAVAVASRAAAAGRSTPGARLFDGYATGLSWARLLTQACADRALTRRAVEAASTTVGPASVDSLFGQSNPAQPVQSGLPATRVSAMSTADPSAPAGLRPLTWLQAAPGIEDYVP